MLDFDETAHSAEALARDWLGAFNAALAVNAPEALSGLFLDDCHWRDIVALTWTIRTVSGREAVVEALTQGVRSAGARTFAVAENRLAPRFVERAGRRVVEVIVSFALEAGRGEGVLRLARDASGGWRAWTLMTALDTLDAAPLRDPAEASDARPEDIRAPNWLDLRRAAQAYENRDPAVLVVGGGHAGLTAAAWLGALGVDTLVVDRMRRVGDNWRKRYHNLKLHNQQHSNHLPFLPFPATWPLYIPKDKIANWLEIYVEAMEINFWTETSFDGASYDAAEGSWAARLTQADGSARTLRPRHIIMATSVSGTPNLPDIPTLDRFGGTVVHSSAFTNGADWAGRNALVFGTGTSAHDIAQNLHANGANVTIVQRSPTLVVNVDPSAQLYDSVLLTEGPTIEDRDLINVATPLEPMKVAHELLTDQVRDIDKATLDGLERAGFRLEFGENGTGWPLKYRTRGGGYYFNVGCSELIISGQIGLIQYAEIATFTPSGVTMADGRQIPADLAVLATGYKGQDHLVRQLFGDDVADRVGQIWGFGPHQELCNMWTATPQPGLWFTAGAFSQCRAFSKYMALQIAARERGVLAG